MRKAAFIYDPRLAGYELSEDHSMKPHRLRYVYELLEAYGAFQERPPVPPREASEEELLSFHTPEYVTAVKRFSQGDIFTDPVAFNFSDSGDNPLFQGIYEVSALVTGASLTAAELLLAGQAEVAFNPAGGLHHAASNHASGFCVFNDPVIAINRLLKEGRRVAYVDIDAHHGDGVQNAFYDTDRVLTISLHEMGTTLFPGTGAATETGTGAGKGYAVNVSLAPYTDDALYLWALEEVVPPLVGAFSPDVLVTQLGCDTHYFDPLTHLALTTRGYEAAVKRLGELSPGRWLALGGGGYEMGVVARAWTLAYGIMMGREWPDDIPQSFQERYGLPRLRDDGEPPISEELSRWARGVAEQSVARVKELVFPAHGL